MVQADLKKIVIICGPTGTGKSELALSLARQLGGEIVSADSQQVYRGMDVGTAKVSREVQDQIPHHLIDVIEPDQHFEAQTFCRLADGAIDSIISKGCVPFVVGGTGFYLRVLCNGICEAPPQDPEYRRELNELHQKEGMPYLHDMLSKIDPAAASNIHPNDVVRLIRALEVYHLTGGKMSELQEQHRFASKRYDALKIGLNVEREELYASINARVDAMMNAGLLDEVRGLVERYGPDIKSLQAVGYREMVAHLKGELLLDQAVELTKKNTRHFAKRQMTWFKADPDIQWFNPEKSEEVSLMISNFLSRS